VYVVFDCPSGAQLNIGKVGIIIEFEGSPSHSSSLFDRVNWLSRRKSTRVTIIINSNNKAGGLLTLWVRHAAPCSSV
jgi:hypothetical protein